MKRALGAVTTWDTFKKMTEGEYETEPLLDEPKAEHIIDHQPAPVQYATPRSHPVTNGEGHNDVNQGATHILPTAQKAKQ